MAIEMKAVITPVGELCWIFINGSTKDDMNGNPRYSAEVHLHKDSEELKAFTAEVDAYWNSVKPKGRKLKSNGIRPVMEKDADDAYTIETDFVAISFWTGPAWPDGKPKVVKIKNAKGTEVSLAGKKIANGSIGRIGGKMAMYDQGVGATGITLFLSTIQLQKFVEYEGGDDGIEAIDGASDDDFSGVDEDGMASLDTTNEAAKPRL